jgi:hypothetical protein
MLLKKCASEIRDATKMVRRLSQRLATDLGEHTGTHARDNIPEMRI